MKIIISNSVGDELEVLTFNGGIFEMSGCFGCKVLRAKQKYWSNKKSQTSIRKKIMKDLTFVDKTYKCDQRNEIPR